MRTSHEYACVRVAGQRNIGLRANGVIISNDERERDGRTRAKRACARASPSFSRFFQSRPQIRQDYPLNLSISISGGKETNKDSPSNGE